MEISEFQNTKELIKGFQARMEKEGEDLFLSMSKTVFDKNPDLEKFGWAQYTPYFNDGDECVFSAHSPKILLKGQDEDMYDEQEYFSRDEISPEAIVWNNVSKFLSQFDDNDLKMFFGDHVQVVVTRDGVEVDEYEHD
jgi:hypothetical protein